jgi:hypothetical protein
LRINPAVRFLTLSVLFLSLSVAQSPNGTISGIVHDPSDRPIPDAEIIIVNDLTNIQYETKTSDDGIYVMPNLPPGSYRIQVTKRGFKTLIKPGLILNVQNALSVSMTLPLGAVSEVITVRGGAPIVNTENASVSTVIDHNFVESLPLNGRSFNMLLQLTPGVVIAPNNANGATGQFSIGGQRASANNFQIDGVSANFGVNSSTNNPGAFGTGGVQAFSATGGTSSLVSVEALQEYRIETSSYAPEFGRSPGGQVVLTTRSGTNSFHGGVYEYFRNDVMDANDWFANSAGNPRAPERHNDFGGYLGGPIWKDRTFFFVSYEGARLRLPQTNQIEVPYIAGPCTPPAALAPFLNAYPKPNGAVSTSSCTGQFTGTYSNSATLDAGSVRLDHYFSDRWSIFGRYNEAPSSTAERSNSLSEIDTVDVKTRTLTVGLNLSLSKMSNALRGNYSVQRASIVNALDSFGGAVPLNASNLLGALSGVNNLVAFQTFDTRYYASGPYSSNQATQFNVADDFSVTLGRHQIKIGEDYRPIFLNAAPYQHLVLASASSVTDFLSTGDVDLSTQTRIGSKLLTDAFSLYGQDTWKISSKLTLVYGMRWELNPAPSARGNTHLASWQNVDDPTSVALAPAGTPLWQTTYRNFAPRIGVAYSPTHSKDVVLRAGWGIFYDLGAGSSADLTVLFPTVQSESFSGVVVPIANASPYLPTISLSPPFAGTIEGFNPDLALPRSYEWNVAIEKSFRGQQALSITYVGQTGRNLLRQQATYRPNSSFSGEFLLTGNDAESSYNALQLQYRRPLVNTLQALLNYTWSHSIDNVSNDGVATLSNIVLSGAGDRGQSDFDVRQSFSGALSYSVPAPRTSWPLNVLGRGWSIDAIVVARSGFPFNAHLILASPDPGGVTESRPDLVPGQLVWVGNALAPGGKTLNAAAFSIPSPVRQGTEGRNDIPGFGFTQVDLSIARRFALGDKSKIDFRVDAFNVINHPNFANPLGFVEFGSAFLSSSQMLNQALGGLSPIFQEGGPRSLQLSLKLNF